MKKALSLFLAVLVLICAVPLFVLSTSAAEGTGAGNGSDTPAYVLYDQDFENIGEGLDRKGLLSALGWTVPESKQDTDVADYSIADRGGNKVLHVSNKVPSGMNADSFVNVFNGDLMSLVRLGNFTLSYDLTYCEGTENTDGYSTLIYNYNGKDGRAISDVSGEVYGISAVRANGLGFNGIYYPKAAGGTDLVLLESTENKDNYVADKTNMIGKKLSIRLEYSYNNGVSVFVNDDENPVSQMDLGTATDFPYWNDFMLRNVSSAIALMTKVGVEADIDNIRITSDSIGKSEEAKKLPELVITQIAPSGVYFSASSDNKMWAEFIEIYNPTDKDIDLRKYSIMFSDIPEGDVNTQLPSNRLTASKCKYQCATAFADLLGKPLKSYNTFYVHETQLKSIPSDRYEYLDQQKYVLKDGKYTADASGTYRKIKYCDTWNARFNSTDERYYERNTMLKAGECLIIYTVQDISAICWTKGVNGSNDTNEIKSSSFRSAYGSVDTGALDKATKVISLNTFNLGDNANRRYYIAYTNEEHEVEEGNGTTRIDYKNRNGVNLEHIVSYISFSTPVAIGKANEDESAVSKSNRGKSGTIDYGTTALYVYGVDASADYRAGTLYCGRQKIYQPKDPVVSVGAIKGGQRAIFDFLYAKDKEEKEAPLAITEIVSNTSTLSGDRLAAFTAMEITNISADSVNLYDYALVRSELDGKIKRYNCIDKTFTRVTEMKAGNPVRRGNTNGAYYYFAMDTVSNPQSCELAPGEVAVVWFLNKDTFEAYSGDSDFSVDYFRQYWVSRGNNALGEKNADGEYRIKVIAVDGNEDLTSNKENAGFIFGISPTNGAVYGIAKATSAIKHGDIKSSDVLNIAYYGVWASYYDFGMQEVEYIDEAGTIYCTNVLAPRRMPVDTSVHYVAGLNPYGNASQMTNSLKVQDYSLSGSTWYYKKGETGKKLAITCQTTQGLERPDLGDLSGIETAAILDHLIVSDGDANHPTNYYFDSLRTDIRTLRGAGLSLKKSETTARLRFDNVVSANVYSTLRSSHNVKVGVLVTETSNAQLLKRAVNMKTVQEAESTLTGTKVWYGDRMYSTDDYEVIGTYVDINVSQYDTSFTAIGFLEVTLPDGTTKIFWSNSTADGCVRTVAQKALADTKRKEDERYCYQIEENIFSPYNDAARNKLQSFVNA